MGMGRDSSAATLRLRLEAGDELTHEEKNELFRANSDQLFAWFDEAGDFVPVDLQTAEDLANAYMTYASQR